MKNKIVVTIADRPYTLVSTDDQAYVEEVAAQVDQLMRSVVQQTRLPPLDAAVLTAVNAMDSAIREQQSAQSLRTQLKDCLEESAKLKQELADARREITRLKKGGKGSEKK